MVDGPGRSWAAWSGRRVRLAVGSPAGGAGRVGKHATWNIFASEARWMAQLLELRNAGLLNHYIDR